MTNKKVMRLSYLNDCSAVFHLVMSASSLVALKLSDRLEVVIGSVLLFTEDRDFSVVRLFCEI